MATTDGEAEVSDGSRKQGLQTEYRPGQVVDGHVLTDEGQWVQIAAPDRYWSRFRRRFRWAAIVALAVLALMVLPIPGLGVVNLGMWPRDLGMAAEFFTDWSYWLELVMLALEALVVVALPIGLVAAAFPAQGRR